MRLPRRAFCRSLASAAAAAALPFGAPPVRARAADLPGTIRAVRGDGTEVALAGRDVADLRARLRGPLLLAGDDGYEGARRVWNGMIDRRPALIARCAGAADIRAAVDFARAHGLLVSVRGGGHGISGTAVCEDGLMIDLADMSHVRVDPAARRAWVGPGALLGALDHEAQAFGLATTAGTVSHTGAAGLTLGGGFGRLARRFGLACDNLDAADVVLADGRLARAGRADDRDLLWALRGGGGNFGVVSSFEYRLHEVGPVVFGGDLMYPFEQARDVLRFYAEACREAPSELCVDWAIVAPPGARPLVNVEVTWAGDLRRGERAVARLRAFGRPRFDRLGPVRYVDLQRSTDAGTAPGRQYYLKSGFLRDVADGLVEELVGGFEPSPSRALVITFQQLGGAIADVGPGDSAFSHRDASHALLMMSGWTKPEETPAHMDFVRGYWARIARFTSGFYVNSYTPDEAQRVVANYRGNYPRLVALKGRYDPGNLFRMNVNVPPPAA